MRMIILLPLAIPLAVLANRTRALADWTEDKHPRLSERLEKLHSGMMLVLIRMEGGE